MKVLPINVLIVEDSPSDALLWQTMFSTTDSQGWRVFWVKRLKEAVDSCRQCQFDVVLLDLSLPDSDGWETVAEFHSAVPDVPVVVLTAEESEEVAMQAMAKGAQDYLVKNHITYHLLLRALRYAIERGQIIKQLRDSQEQYRVIFNGSFQLMAVLSVEGICLDINQTALDFFKKSRQDFLGKRIWETQFWRESEETKQLFQTAILTAAEGKLFRDEIQIKGMENGGVWVDFSLKPVVDEKGKVVLLIAEARDISDRKKAENALQDAKEQLQAVLNAVPGIVAWVDRDLRYLGVNQNLANIKDLRAADFVGKKVGFHKKGLDLRDFLQEFMASSGMAASRIIELEILGGRKNYLIVAQKYQQGLAAVIVGIDITERKKIEEEIVKTLEKERELNQLKSGLMRLLFHDIRNPISKILVSAQMLHKFPEDFDIETRNQQFEQIYKSIGELLNLLDEVLVRSQTEAGKLLYKPTSMPLRNIAQELVKSITPVREDTPIVFIWEGEEGPVEMDEFLVRHILTNLLHNAVKYSPQGGEISFKCKREENLVIFKVKDQGIGIPLKDQAELFETFHRASNVGKIKGTGLGLSIVKKCVDLHGGEIELESQEGVGTTFIVKLPLKKCTLSVHNAPASEL
ncbi:ATP-binding protein [Ancylothrix sp. C2]|uniref:hybrid sensor histidine kinase/response regulator n=1 Tax=Ancylothrix sp. D3o TaxID=2953691 RepID=UPI0021BAE8F1|nr:ATP-binding protein [Ancylothrix sp. D3o]MCT7952508.1 ATP-binding protein [Ancylothrix sp. D3o]